VAILEELEARMRAIAREEIAAAREACAEDWIDQSRSPLGRKLHCALVRDGVLPGVKVHRRVLVRRRDLDAYLETHRQAPAIIDGSEEARALARVGARRVG
jgi:hypothetical protein